MPIIDLQSKLGINLDRWMLSGTAEQPYKRPTRCHAFEKDWIECSHGIGQVRAKQECKLEFEDLYECMHHQKMFWRLHEIKKQRDKMIKEKSYTPPAHHTGSEEARP